MTLEHDDAPTTDASAIWSSPESNLWVASLAGEYAGMIEFRDGHFVARDSTGNELGYFSSIPAARTAVNDGITAALSPVAAHTPRFIRPASIARALRSRQGGAV